MRSQNKFNVHFRSVVTTHSCTRRYESKFLPLQLVKGAMPQNCTHKVLFNCHKEESPPINRVAEFPTGVCEPGGRPGWWANNVRATSVNVK